MTDQPPQALLDHRSDPDARMVLEDWERSHGWTPTRIAAAAATEATADSAMVARAALFTACETGGPHPLAVYYAEAECMLREGWSP